MTSLRLGRLKAVLVSCTLIFLAGCTAVPGGNLPDSPIAGDRTPQLLFVQYAPAGTLVQIGDGNPLHYTLTLSDVLPVATYFADLPHRIAGTLPTEVLISLDGLFDADDPPNGAISAKNAANDLLGSVVFELRDPVYDDVLNNLFYDAILIESEGVPGLSPWDLSGGALPRNLEEINLFIDDVACVPEVNPMCTD